MSAHIFNLLYLKLFPVLWPIYSDGPFPVDHLKDSCLALRDLLE